jgi:hypothetical protein
MIRGLHQKAADEHQQPVRVVGGGGALPYPEFALPAARDVAGVRVVAADRRGVPMQALVMSARRYAG